MSYPGELEHAESPYGDTFNHDWRCMGDCYHCGGCGGIEANLCLYCGGSGECQGCNPQTALNISQLEAAVEEASS